MTKNTASGFTDSLNCNQSPGKPFWRVRLSTVDLLVLALISCFWYQKYIFLFFTKKTILMRRSTVLNLPSSYIVRSFHFLSKFSFYSFLFYSLSLIWLGSFVLQRSDVTIILPCAPTPPFVVWILFLRMMVGIHKTFWYDS